GVDNHRSISIERHGGVGFTPGWWPLTHGDAAPDVRGFGGAVPGRNHGSLQSLPGPHALVTRPCWCLIPFCDQVPQPKVEWVHAQLPSNAVDMGFDGEDGLRLARGTHEAAGDGVGIHLDTFEAHMGDLIRPASLRRSTQIDGGDGLESPISAT